MNDRKNIINRTIEYLEKNYPQKQKIDVIICEGYDCIEGPDGTKGFGVFVPSECKIYLATDVPEYKDTLIETTAHEYMHFMQHCQGTAFDEYEAEEFAMRILRSMQA